MVIMLVEIYLMFKITFSGWTSYLVIYFSS